MLDTLGSLFAREYLVRIRCLWMVSRMILKGDGVGVILEILDTLGSLFEGT